MINSSHAFADGGLHETRKRRQHVDWGVDLPVVQVSVNKYLAFGDVASQVGNGMSDVIVRHCQNGELGDRAVFALDTSGALVDGRQISVHVTGVATTARHLLTGGRYLSKGVSVRGHVSQNDEHVHLLFVGKVLSSCEGETGSDNALDGGIVCQVHEQHDTVHGAVDLEIGLEESSGLSVDSHCRENDGEVRVVVIEHVLSFHQRCLPTDLSTDLIVRKTSSGEEWNLLTSGDRVHDVDGGDSGLDHLLWVDSLVGVDGLTLDIEELFSENWRAMINRRARSVERATKHLDADRHSQDIARELAMRVQIVDA